MEDEGLRRGQSPESRWDFGRVKPVESKDSLDEEGEKEVLILRCSPERLGEAGDLDWFSRQSFQKGKSNFKGESSIFFFFLSLKAEKITLALRRGKAREREIR